MGRSGYCGSFVEDGSGGAMITRGVKLLWRHIHTSTSAGCVLPMWNFFSAYSFFRFMSYMPLRLIFKDAQCIRRALMSVYSLSSPFVLASSFSVLFSLPCSVLSSVCLV